MIDSHIPIPETRGRKPRYRFHLMAVGDSQFFAGVKANTIAQAILRAARKTGHSFTYRYMWYTQGDDSILEGYRVWRVK